MDIGISRETFKSPINLFFVFLTVLYVGWSANKWQSTKTSDYYQFWVMGQALANKDVENIYSVEGRKFVSQKYTKMALESGSTHFQAATDLRSDLRTVGTPFLYTIFYFLSSGDFDVDYGRFRVLSLLLFLGGLIWLAYSLSLPAYQTFLFLVIATYFNVPYRDEVRSCNVNQFLIGAYTIVFLIRKIEKPLIDFLTAFCLGALFTFKPITAPALFLLLFIWIYKKPPRLTSIGGLAAGAASGIFIPLILFGATCDWKMWYPFFKKVVLSEAHYRNQSLLGLAGLRYNRANFVATTFLCAAPIALEIFKQHLISNAQTEWLNEFRLFWMGICVYILTGPLVHLHYFLLPLPLVLYLLKTNAWQIRSPENLLPLIVVSSFVVLTMTVYWALPIIGRLSVFKIGYLMTLILYAGALCKKPAL